MNIFVGNLNFKTTEEELRGEFSAFGTVDNVHIVMDKFTGRARGFAFVEMPEQAEAQAAIDRLNGATVGQRQIVVNEAKPRTEGGGGGNRGGGNRDGGGGGYKRREYNDRY
ncbi:RNA-binding protein [Chitinophagaceae bacterium IBVUCB1]|nr:RNA-binding protein [Chitinophagaceae bacterium IBVUCB1]